MMAVIESRDIDWPIRTVTSFAGMLLSVTFKPPASAMADSTTLNGRS
jgi:hypothetical protein